VSFQSPLFLVALLGVPLLLAAYRMVQQRRKRYAVRFPGVSTLAALTASEPQWRRHLPTALFALALATLAIALARPEATVAVPIEQASVVLVTDVSRSMQADDVEPSRLDAAKKAAHTFIDRLPATLNIGAVAFSSAPHTVQRPTRDHQEVEALIDGLTADGATATGDALAAALALLGKQKPQKRPPSALVLLSDGKTTTGRDPVEVAREARKAHVPIYTVALGTKDGVLSNGPYGGGLPVPPDPVTLRKIAEASGGRAFTAKDGGELDTVYDRLGSEIGTRSEKREITAGFAAGGILLLLTASAASIRSLGRLP
jgi:Ca-activated chloride channel homolog